MHSSVMGDALVASHQFCHQEAECRWSAAGIQAIKLEELERRLRTDIMQEAIAWAGRVMLHKEVSIDLPAARQPAPDQTATSSTHMHVHTLHHCILCSTTALAKSR